MAHTELDVVRQMREKVAAILEAIDDRAAVLGRQPEVPVYGDADAGDGYIYPKATMSLYGQLADLGEWAMDEEAEAGFNPLPFAETIAGEPAN